MRIWGINQLIIAVCLLSTACAQLSLWGPETSWTWSSWSTVRLKVPYNKIIAHELDERYQFQSDIGPESREFYTTQIELMSPATNDVLAWTLMKCSVCRIMAGLVWEPLRLKMHQLGAYAPHEVQVTYALINTCKEQVPALAEMFSLRAPTPGLSRYYPYTAQMCERMLEAPIEFAANPLVTSLVVGLRTYASEMNKRLTAEKKVTLGVERIPVKNVCEDYHPRCPLWAAQGECEKNPKYMTSIDPPGYCHLSCGMCLASQSDGEMPTADSGNALSLELAKTAQTTGCREARVCDGIDESLIPEAVPMSHNPKSKKKLDELRDLLDERKQATRTSRVLSESAFQEMLELASKYSPPGCITKPMGWWTYEYCHKRHVRQIHYNQVGIRLQIIELGRFDPDAQPQQQMDQVADVDLEPVQLVSDLFGYYKIVMTGGDLCQVDGQDNQVHRQTEVRLACSPQENTFVAVKEVRQCKYLMTIFDSSMCLRNNPLSPVHSENKLHDEL